jgi:hypothetical protein
MEMVIMNTFENLTVMVQLWAAFMAVVLLAFAPTRQKAHHIIDKVYDTADSILAMAGSTLVETLVLLGCGLVVAAAVMAVAIEAVTIKVAQAKAWVVAWARAKADAWAEARAAAKAKAEAEALAAFARQAKAAGFVHKDEVRSLIRKINEQSAQLISWECDYNSLQTSLDGAEEEIIELNGKLDELVRKKYPHGVQVRVEAVVHHEAIVRKSIEDFNMNSKPGRKAARTYLREQGVEVADSTNSSQIAKKFELIN